MAAMMNATSTPWESASTIKNNFTIYNFTTNVGQNCDVGGPPRHLLLAIYTLILVVGFIGNALVVWVITVGTQRKSTTDVCLLNMALADLLLVLSIPFLIYQANHGWIFGEVVYTLVFGMYFIGFYGGIFFIVLMSIDRYLAIVHAVLAMKVRTRLYGIVASLVIWVLAVAVSFPELLNIRVEKQSTVERCIAKAYDKNSAIFISFKRIIMGLLVPLIIVGFCYSMILKRINRSRLPHKHTMHLIVLVMVVFVCCWAPYNITQFVRGLLLIGVIPFTCKYKIWMAAIRYTRIIAYSHSCLNPFLYVFAGEKFRKHLIRLIREHHSSSSSERIT